MNKNGSLIGVRDESDEKDKCSRAHHVSSDPTCEMSRLESRITLVLPDECVAYFYYPLVRSTTGGYVFTCVCLSMGGRGIPWSLVLSGGGGRPVRDGGIPVRPVAGDPWTGQGLGQRTGYAAGSTPLAVTQENFLITQYCHRIEASLRGARSQTSNSWSFIYFTLIFH